MTRERIVFWGALGALVAAAAIAYLVLVGPTPAGRAPPPAPALAAPSLRIAAAAGEVTVVRGGVRARAAAGDELRADDAIETALGASVELAGGGYAVTLEEGGRFAVGEITRELSRFRLAEGLVSARVDDDPGRAVEIQGGEASARTRGGDVTVSRKGAVVAVGVRRGRAELSSGGATVAVEAGRQSEARGGAAPSPPAPLPPSLLLKVTWPAPKVTNERRIVVKGRATPGAVVVLGGEKVEVLPDGRFTHVIVLREGRQQLTARAYGVAGKATSEGPAVVLDTRAPDARFDTRDLWAPGR